MQYMLAGKEWSAVGVGWGHSAESACPLMMMLCDRSGRQLAAGWSVEAEGCVFDGCFAAE